VFVALALVTLVSKSRRVGVKKKRERPSLKIRTTPMKSVAQGE